MSMIKFKMKVIIYDAIDWLAEYIYDIDGCIWRDQKNFNPVIPKKGRTTTTDGWKGTTRRNPVVLEIERK